LLLNKTIIIKSVINIVLFIIISGCDSGTDKVSDQTFTPLNLLDEISPQKAIADMGIGINLGNTLDAPNEGDWAKPAQESFIVAFKDAGFKHVRIPVTWHQHVQKVAPYDIDGEFLERVEKVLDWALEQDLYVILNAHHESWLKEDYQDKNHQARFERIWEQIAAHFKNKSAKLMFEILNEPNGMTVANVNEVNKRILSIIRNENPTRLVVFSGNGYTPIDSLLMTDIPDMQDKFLIGNFHSYDPWKFAGQCTQSWGGIADEANLRNIYQRASDWSITNQIPIMVNEFGAAKYDRQMKGNICDLSQRLDYLAHHVSLATEFGIAASFWDDGRSFSTFDRTNNTWGPEKDVLVSKNK
jgi:endoglucanase